MNNEFSYFSAPILNTRPTMRCGLREVYELIRSEKWAQTTMRLRSLASAVERREYKAYNLDFVTFSGVFKVRRNSALLEYSNLICIDIDHIGNEKEVRAMQQRFVEDTYLMPQLIFRSPSGDGLKMVIECNAKSAHNKRYNDAIRHIERRYGVRPDNTPDVARACFLCSDEEVYFRGEGECLSVSNFQDEEIVEEKICERKIDFRNTIQISDYERIECIVKRIEGDRRDVTTPYRKWFRIGLALASIFGEEGRELYHRISRFYDGYSPQETERQYNYCIRYTNHTTSIGTLIYLLNR